MQFADAARQLDPEIYRRLRHALELGKWPDGRVLSEQQKMITMEAVLHYEQSNDIPENERVGYLESQCKSVTAGNESSPLRFVNGANKADL
ncbi:DUF1315 family protein [Hydrocarboniclastica marina]|uniref:DUF1315 family protein n=1 Tax=Hydrocarboniclastica marina TaxID=2259620 RepID=A0A4P7XHV5_9ALTE|nr:DUF1315 family protein [Hydrocarboniclastica marina]QCF25417.1 DUF1315 family protein [Hydrocarboniclastica marina]